MATDLRTAFIVKQITNAAREICPNLPDPPIDEQDMQIVSIGLKVFDLLMPMIVSAVISEYKKQKS